MILDESVKKIIGAVTGIWFYSNNIRSHKKNSKVKQLILLHLKSNNGGIMSKVKDQDGNSYSIITSLPQPFLRRD